MKDELQDVSGPPGEKYTLEQLPEAIKALQDGKDIDYEGAAGPIDLDDERRPDGGASTTSSASRAASWTTVKTGHCRRRAGEP